MIEFYFGCMGSSKSKQLIESYRIQSKLKDIKILTCLAHFDESYPIDGCIKTRAHDDVIIQKFVLTPQSNLDNLIGYDVIFIDEAHFLTPDCVRFLASLDSDIRCFGLLTAFNNEIFAGSQALLFYADKLIRLESKCEYCNRQATHNIRLVNGERVFSGEQFILKTTETITYKAVCRDCFEKGLK